MIMRLDNPGRHRSRDLKEFTALAQLQVEEPNIETEGELLARLWQEVHNAPGRLLGWLRNVQSRTLTTDLPLATPASSRKGGGK